MGAAALAIAFMAGAGAAEASFSAHGSVEQVYVTGLGPGAQMSLLNRGGQDGRHEARRRAGRPAVPQRQAGNRLPRPPARGGAKSGPLTVLSTRPAPPSTDVYNQTIPADGYGYLTTRDGTKLAIDVHPPQDVTNAAAGRRSSARPRPVPRRR